MERTVLRISTTAVAIAYAVLSFVVFIFKAALGHFFHKMAQERGIRALKIGRTCPSLGATACMTCQRHGPALPDDNPIEIREVAPPKINSIAFFPASAPISLTPLLSSDRI
jgi:hypothetical protein